MAIRRNKRIHEFEWEFDAETSNQQKLLVPVMYHDTEEYGPTVTITDDEGDVILSLPATFFREVLEEMDEEDYRSGIRSKPESRKATSKMVENNSLDLPTIERSEPTIAAQSNAVSVMTEEEARSRTDYSKVDQDSVPVVSFTSRPAKSAVRKEEEIEILQERGGTPEERLARRNLVKKNEKASIKKAHE